MKGKSEEEYIRDLVNQDMLVKKTGETLKEVLNALVVLKEDPEAKKDPVKMKELLDKMQRTIDKWKQ